VRRTFPSALVFRKVINMILPFFFKNVGIPRCFLQGAQHDHCFRTLHIIFFVLTARSRRSARDIHISLLRLKSCRHIPSTVAHNLRTIRSASIITSSAGPSSARANLFFVTADSNLPSTTAY
jgi:hypothetical protein